MVFGRFLRKSAEQARSNDVNIEEPKAKWFKESVNVEDRGWEQCQECHIPADEDETLAAPPTAPSTREPNEADSDSDWEWDMPGAQPSDDAVGALVVDDYLLVGECSASASASPLENSSDLSCDAGPSTPAPQPLPPPPPPPTGDSKAALKAPEAWLEEEESPSVCASPDSNEGWLDEHSSPSVCPSAGSDVEATEEACPGSPWTSLSGSWSPRKRSRSTPSQRERSRSRLAGRTVLGNACAETLVRPKEE